MKTRMRCEYYATPIHASMHCRYQKPSNTTILAPLIAVGIPSIQTRLRGSLSRMLPTVQKRKDAKTGG